MTTDARAMGARELLAALHGGSPSVAAHARGLLRAAPDPQQRAERAARRAAAVARLAETLAPGDVSIVRWLLEQEIAEHVAAGSGASEALYTLVAALARFGRPADAPLIWRAHEATPETRTGVDIEQVARGGVEATRRWLRRAAVGEGPQAEAAAGALAWLEAGAAVGAFDDLPGYFTWADARFGLAVAGPI